MVRNQGSVSPSGAATNKGSVQELYRTPIEPPDIGTRRLEANFWTFALPQPTCVHDLRRRSAPRAAAATRSEADSMKSRSVTWGGEGTESSTISALMS